MKTDAQVIQEMIDADMVKMNAGELSRANALVFATSQVHKGKATRRGGLLTMRVDALAVGEVAEGDRIPVLFLLNKTEYERIRAAEIDGGVDLKATTDAFKSQQDATEN